MYIYIYIHANIIHLLPASPAPHQPGLAARRGEHRQVRLGQDPQPLGPPAFEGLYMRMICIHTYISLSLSVYV